jgi:hypothetical protein
MEQSSSWEADSRSAGRDISPSLIEQCSNESGTRPYTEPDKSIPQLHALFLQGEIKVNLSLYLSMYHAMKTSVALLSTTQ